MLKRSGTAVLSVVVACGVLTGVGAAKAKADKPGYIGSKMCIACHKKRDDAAEKWEKTKHAGAYEALATAAAKKLAKDPQKDPKCIQCHVTGLDQPGGFSLKADAGANASLKGVTCEACHAPGGEYKKVMMKGMGGNFDKEAAKKAGLVIPTAATCVQCHNKKSPSFKSFDFNKRWAIIKHGEKKKK